MRGEDPTTYTYVFELPHGKGSFDVPRAKPAVARRLFFTLLGTVPANAAWYCLIPSDHPVRTTPPPEGKQ